jgi:FeS assembly SUF system protein
MLLHLTDWKVKEEIKMDKRIDQIIENLKQVYDPEIPVNVYDLGLIYNVDVDENNNANIVMTLTAPGCPVVDILMDDVTGAARSVEGIEKVNVDLTFDPPWDKSMMSEEARLELGFF